MAEAQKSGPSLNTRLAKAESLLLLAFCMETVVTPWIFAQVQLQPVWKTLLKMLVVVGCFGPLFKLISYVIDSGLSTTRNLTTSTLSLPKMASHALIMLCLFTGFYWSMNHTFPWNDFHFAERRAAEIRR